MGQFGDDLMLRLDIFTHRKDTDVPDSNVIDLADARLSRTLVDFPSEDSMIDPLYYACMDVEEYRLHLAALQERSAPLPTYRVSDGGTFVVEVTTQTKVGTVVAIEYLSDGQSSGRIDVGIKGIGSDPFAA